MPEQLSPHQQQVTSSTTAPGAMHQTAPLSPPGPGSLNSKERHRCPSRGGCHREIPALHESCSSPGCPRHLVQVPRFEGTPTAELSPGTRDPRAPTKTTKGCRRPPRRRELVPTAADSTLKASGSSWLSAVMLGCWLPNKAPGLSPCLLVSSPGSWQVKCSCDSLKEPPFSEREKRALTQLASSLSSPNWQTTQGPALSLCPCQRPVEGTELSVASGTPPCSALLSNRLLGYEPPTADDTVARVQLERSENKRPGELKASPGSQGPVLPLTHSLGFPATVPRPPLAPRECPHTQCQNWRAWRTVPLKTPLPDQSVSDPDLQNVQSPRGLPEARESIGTQMWR